jgi:simple sugar transport system ATP-binding protein
MTEWHHQNGALGVEAVSLTMRFGNFTALDAVSIRIRPGSFHALLGENGAGKSTFVKCLMGFYQASDGNIIVGGHEVHMTHPRVAQGLGLGMVYQHFTLVPSLTGAENLVISRGDVPMRIDWAAENRALREFMARMPFTAPLDRPVADLSAGEKQKLEILKQLYLGHRFLVLDEPTSVLTPQEATEILSHVRALTRAGEITVLMITHKFREVTEFADEVTVLRNGIHAGHGTVGDLSPSDMARMMIGERQSQPTPDRAGEPGATVLSLHDIRARDRSGLREIEIEDLKVRSGEIVGIAGISGNGQSDLMEILTGQRSLIAGEMRVHDVPYHARRSEAQRLKVRYLPEEPLHNACAPRMSVADNLALRSFDDGRGIWLDRAGIAARAETRIAEFNIKTRSRDAPVRALSGGNVQRTALARELTGDVDLLIVANPCFGLDFAATEAIHDRIMAARNSGTAVLMISEDLDELLKLADRIVVMAEGSLVHETPAAAADPAVLGQYMSGHA